MSILRLRLAISGSSPGLVRAGWTRGSGLLLERGGMEPSRKKRLTHFYMTAHIIFALNAIVSRRLRPFDPAVVSIGSIRGGYTENVIPDRVEITGTLRYTEKRVQEQIHAEIKRAFEVVRSLGGNYELRIELGDIPMQNHPEAVKLIRETAGSLLGDEHVLLPTQELGAEDFGRFSELAPGAMFTLGTRIEGG